MYSKRYGNRDEVFNGIARQTTGGLNKEDIEKKVISGGKIVYISKRMSSVMKAKDNLYKFRQKRKTMRQNAHEIGSGTKSKKIKFINNPTIKQYYYPELKGENLEKLRANYLEEEKEDFGLEDEEQEKKKDELKKFDISHLDEELNNLFKSA